MGSKPTIVLLENDPALSGLVADGLRHEGYPVVAAPSAAEASSTMERLGGKAVLIADRALGPTPPNGFDLASAALERYPSLRVIYVSGTHTAVKHRRLSDRERGLLKPFALSQLVGLVRQLS